MTHHGDRPSDGPYVHLADEYGALLGPLARHTWRCGIVAELLRLDLPAGVAVADLGAGTGIGGQLLGAVLERPHRVGVDRSPAMLAHAGRHYEQTIVGDLIEPGLPAGHMHAIVAGFDTLNYLPRSAFAVCLGAAARALTAGGWLIFDHSSPHLLRRLWRDHQSATGLDDGGELRWRHRYDPARDQCTTVLSRHEADGAVRWHETHVQYTADIGQIADMAAAAGLLVEQVRDLDRTAFTPAAPTHVWRLRKEN